MSTIIPGINKNIKGPPVNYGEFLVFLGIWLIMSTTVGIERRLFWSLSAVSMFSGAPYRFNEYMSGNRFDSICDNLTFTLKGLPSFKDRFWQVCKMILEWNKNMKEKFTPSWITCLDESMSTWANKFTCPGYMFVPRKPWPFGNEYHTICCAVCGILFGIELVEGKDKPPEIVPEFNNAGGPTVGLLLRLTKSL